VAREPMTGAALAARLTTLTSDTKGLDG
jgi:hypothetical protein